MYLKKGVRKHVEMILTVVVDRLEERAVPRTCSPPQLLLPLPEAPPEIPPVQ
jgi:hypothetical protein